VPAAEVSCDSMEVIPSFGILRVSKSVPSKTPNASVWDIRGERTRASLFHGATAHSRRPRARSTPMSCYSEAAWTATLPERIPKLPRGRRWMLPFY